MIQMMKFLHKRRKSIISLIGVTSTWAITEFPTNHNVQIVCGLIGVVLTSTLVHAVPNAPTGD